MLIMLIIIIIIIIISSSSSISHCVTEYLKLHEMLVSINICVLLPHWLCVAVVNWNV